nr:radical SAM-associated putative lipoprotein [uncultured Bacteroides sp.]
MKKRNTTLLNLANKVLSGMMVLLGFNGCSGETPCMYGSPYALHTIKGKVESNAGTAIKGIQIICNTNNNWIKPDTLLSNANGEFTYKSEPAIIEITYKLICKDIDGETNGSYKKDSIEVEFKKSDLVNGEGWFEGEATKNVTIKLSENDK